MPTYLLSYYVQQIDLLHLEKCIMLGYHSNSVFVNWSSSWFFPKNGISGNFENSILQGKKNVHKNNYMTGIDWVDRAPQYVKHYHSNNS